MKEKKFVSAGSFTTSIIVKQILFALIVVVLIAVIGIFAAPFLLLIPTALQEPIAMLLGVLLNILVWRWSVGSVVKKKTTDREKIPSIARNLLILFLAMLLITTVLDVIQFEQSISQTLNNSYGGLLGGYLTDTMNENIDKIRLEEYVKLGISTMVNVVVTLCMVKYTTLKLEKEL